LTAQKNRRSWQENKMMTAKDKVKRFIILTTSPYVLTDDEMRALWTIARHEGKIIFQTNNSRGLLNPFIQTDKGIIVFPRHIIGTLERRGILKQRSVLTFKRHHIAVYTWNIVWKKVKTFEQTKELRIQKAVGSI
jgi:hypothetical protein